MKLVGRKEQLKTVDIILNSHKAEFVTVVGRRRVGKTYFIEKAFEKNISFRMTGIQDGTMEEQLTNFANCLAEYMEAPFVPTPPENWQSAFYQLKLFLKSKSKKRKQVVFIDELPWAFTPRSGFLKMLAHFWNDFLSKEKHFVLVICGSATSWITNKIINDKGGLHNRISHVIPIKAFDLSETKLFLESRNLHLNNNEIVKLYMTMGGIPFYLENIRRGETATTAIDRMCFQSNGILKNEYNNLYKALFYNYRDHEKIVNVLSKSRKGLSREELIKKSKVKDGGSFNRTMEDLMLSDFVSDYVPFNRKKRGSLYRLDDEFSVFYNRFIKPNKKPAKGLWLQLSASQSYKIWTGYAFEAVCFKHIDEIKNALGISGVYTEIASYREVGNKYEAGFQIDLVLKRKDNAINLCEIKYYDSDFKIDAKYAKKLIDRRFRFMERTKTKAIVFTTMITNHNLVFNEHSIGVVDATVTLDNLMA